MIAAERRVLLVDVTHAETPLRVEVWCGRRALPGRRLARVPTVQSLELTPKSVSVIVPTRNSARTLGACLASVRSQSYPAIELVVVDNRSTDASAAIADRHAHIVAHTGPERSAQRNHGVAISSGSFVLIIDSDMVLGKRVVEECVEAASADGFAALVIPERSVGEGFWAACKALERSCYVGDDTIEAARFFTRDVYERYGGYDESMIGPEDWDLPARIRRHERIGRIEAEIVHLEGCLRLRDSMRKKFYYGQHLSSYLRRHPDLAKRQLVPIRPAFVRHRRRLMQTPVLTMGMLAMKTAEFAAGGFGFALSRLGGMATKP